MNDNSTHSLYLREKRAKRLLDNLRVLRESDIHYVEPGSAEICECISEVFIERSDEERNAEAELLCLRDSRSL